MMCRLSSCPASPWSEPNASRDKQKSKQTIALLGIVYLAANREVLDPCTQIHVNYLLAPSCGFTLGTNQDMKKEVLYSSSE